MTGPFRRHTLIEATIEDVWAVISDPRTHPGWWPEVEDVEVPEGGLSEGDAYTRMTKRYGFGEIVDTVWVAERLDHLKEAHFRCTLTGTYARFSVTPAQDRTFVELETGMLPEKLRYRLTSPFWGILQRRWMDELVANLPDAVPGTGEPDEGGPA